MKKRYWAVLLVLVILPACGGGAASQYRDDVEPTMDEDVRLLDEQIATEQRLEEALSRPEPDCEAACDLGESICDLGTRICAIAGRNAMNREMRSRCEDASARCDRARTRIAEQCTCAP